MSDGVTEAYHYFRDLFNSYLEAVVRHLELTNEGLDPNERDYAMKRVNKFGSELVRLKPEVMGEYTDLPRDVCNMLQNSMADGGNPACELLLMALFLSEKRTLITRVQKCTAYRQKLLIFINREHHVEPLGIFYLRPMTFMNGDQDILLGFAKKRYARIFDQTKDRPLLIVAKWHYARKCWNVENVFAY